MNLFSYYLPTKITQIQVENIFNIKFKKSIESSFFFEEKEKIIFLTKFNVITFIGYESSEIEFKLKKENLTMIQQDYPIEIKSNLDSFWEISNDKIYLKEFSSKHIQIIALVISQSVGLEKYELRMDELLKESGTIIQNYSYSIKNRNRLSLFLKNLSLMRHEMLMNLFLLDKPNIVWEDEDLEKLYQKLDSILEIKTRYESIDYKMMHLKGDVESLMDFISHKQSEFLEWIIIFLILFEIIFNIFEK